MRIKKKESILQRLVFELRYRYGYSYLDVCGRTINVIQKDFPEWIVRNDQPNPQNAPFVSISNTCAFNFSSHKLDFSLEKPMGKGGLQEKEISEFINQVEALCDIVIDLLGLKIFTRMGFRSWYIFACENKEDAENWLINLGLHYVSPELIKAFEGKLESLGMSMVINGIDRYYRLSLTGVERTAQIDLGQGILNINAHSLHKDQRKFLLDKEKVKRRILQNPEFAAMIDIDSYIEDPETINTSDFIVSSMNQYTKSLESITKI